MTWAGAVALVGSSVAFVGLLLTLANIAVFLELRSTTLHAVKGAYGDGDVQLRLQDGLALLEWRPNDNATTYGVRATHAIARSVVHAWPAKDAAEFRIIVPVTENWILNALGALRPQLRHYTLWDHRKALIRGVGICGHVSSMLVGFLREHGFDARIVGLTVTWW